MERGSNKGAATLSCFAWYILWIEFESSQYGDLKKQIGTPCLVFQKKKHVQTLFYLWVFMIIFEKFRVTKIGTNTLYMKNKLYFIVSGNIKSPKSCLGMKLCQSVRLAKEA